MPREIQDQNTTWTLAQAYAGLEELHSARKDVAAEGGRVRVVATPGGGAQSVALQLPADWEKSLEDENLLRQIHAARDEPTAI